MPIDLEPLATPLLVDQGVVDFHRTPNFPWARWFGQIRTELEGLKPAPFSTLRKTTRVGTMAIINDSTVNTWGAVVAGQGAFTVLAWFNGTNWTVLGQ